MRPIIAIVKLNLRSVINPMPPDLNSSCPIPLQQYPHILMAHGGGGRLMHQLIQQMFLSAFGSNPDWQHDAARLTLPHGAIAFTTDSYVVSPLFFPGGDIGSMAVYGTVNDLAMSGAIPQYLSLSFILEEGLSMDVLWQVVQSIQVATKIAEVKIVTGDTKVVERGKGDGLYINTAGVGVINHPWHISPHAIQPGDAILLSGDIGRHAIAIMAQREGLEFQTPLESDLAPVSQQVQSLLNEGLEVHCLRDLTRGGLATALNEIATASQYSIQINSDIPINDSVEGACEILGLDPLYLANEGRFIVILPESLADAGIQLLNDCSSRLGIDARAQQIGQVESVGLQATPRVSLPIVKQNTGMGSNRIIGLNNGEQMPRIC